MPHRGTESHDGGRVVIIGAGFGGLEAARQLGRRGLPATVIDRQNYHLFQPLLYQVATAALSPADVAEPIRRILSPYPSLTVLMGEVTGIDLEWRTVALADGSIVPFHRLVVATGATYSYFGHDEWAFAAPGLKTIQDARTIRSRLLFAFERAEIESDRAEQRRLMTIAVIGGGPTGVEMAGSIAELARYALARDFRRIRPDRAAVLLIEAGPRLLGAFPEALATYAETRLRRLGVTVLLNTMVQDVSATSITVEGRPVPVGTLVWAAGVAASPVGRWLGVATDRSGRVPVGPDLSVPGIDGVYVIGDLAAAAGEDGKPLPGLAQVAKQQGHYLGQSLAAELTGREYLPRFRFHNRGNAAIVGRHAAVFDFGKWHLTGFPAWILWAVVHVYLLVGFRNRIMVSAQWLWRYITYERGARLIADDPVLPKPRPSPASGDSVAAGDEIGRIGNKGEAR